MPMRFLREHLPADGTEQHLLASMHDTQYPNNETRPLGEAMLLLHWYNCVSKFVGWKADCRACADLHNSSVPTTIGHVICKRLHVLSGACKDAENPVRLLRLRGYAGMHLHSPPLKKLDKRASTAAAAMRLHSWRCSRTARRAAAQREQMHAAR